MRCLSVVTGRAMRLDTELACWYAVADDPGRSWEDKLAATIQRAFPPHEHEQFIAHYRGLLAAWVADQRAASGRQP